MWVIIVDYTMNQKHDYNDAIMKVGIVYECIIGIPTQCQITHTGNILMCTELL
jgi:hypothetical protein